MMILLKLGILISLTNSKFLTFRILIKLDWFYVTQTFSCFSNHVSYYLVTNKVLY